MTYKIVIREILVNGFFKTNNFRIYTDFLFLLKNFENYI